MQNYPSPVRGRFKKNIRHYVILQVSLEFCQSSPRARFIIVASEPIRGRVIASPTRWSPLGGEQPVAEGVNNKSQPAPASYYRTEGDTEKKAKGNARRASIRVAQRVINAFGQKHLSYREWQLLIRDLLSSVMME